MKNILALATYESPASAYPRVKLGSVEIRNERYARGFYHCYGLEGHEYWQALKPLNMTGLWVDNSQWMIDDPPHWFAMKEHASFYSGHVAVAGLGLGLIVHSLMANPNVTKITVVEREPNVIKLIQPLLPHVGKSLEILKGDWNYETVCDVQGVFYDLFAGENNPIMGAQALGVMINLLHKYPGASVHRIHGFKNKRLKELASHVILHTTANYRKETGEA